MRIFSIVIGIILIISGFYFALTPFSTFAAVGWLVGFVLLVTGIGMIINYMKLHKTTNTKVWDLMSGILTTVLGLFVMYGQFTRMVLDAFIIILFGIWVVGIGFLRIIAGIQLNKLGQQAGVLSIIVGVISVIVGLYGFMNPYIFKFAIGWMIGFMFMMSGINMLGFAFSLDSKK